MVGGATVLGWFVFGPGGGAVAGGAVSGLLAYRRTGSVRDAAIAAAVGAGAGLLGGAVGMKLLGIGAAPAAQAATKAVAPAVHAATRALAPYLFRGGGSAIGYYFSAPDLPLTLPWKWVGKGSFGFAVPPLPFPGLRMPHQQNPEFPPKYYYAPDLQAWYEGGGPKPYRGLAQTVREFWESFGDPTKAAEVRETIGLPDVAAISKSQNSRVGASYEAMALELASTYQRFRNIHEQVVKLAQESAAISREGQAAIIQLIDTGINQQAPVVPPDGTTETEWITQYVLNALSVGSQALEQATSAQQRLATKVDARTQALTQDRAELQRWLGEFQRRQQESADSQRIELQRRLDELQRRQQESADREQRRLEESRRRLEEAMNRRPPPERESRPPDPGAGRNRWNDGLALLLEQLRLEQLRAQQSRATQALQVPPVPPIPAFAPQPPPATPPPPVATPNARALGGLGGLDSLLPQLLLQSALANRSGLDAGRNDDRLRDERDALRQEQRRLREEQERLRESERERRDRHVAPPPPVAAAANPPPPPPPPRLDPAAPPAGQQATNAAPAQGGAAERNPDEDGMVLYTFEDGRQQRVLPVVAQALDVALNDNAGTNAQAAYGDTSAKWDDDKEIGKRIDPNQLMTGDVCAFEKGTAITVVWGSPDSGGTLEMVVDGKLVPFNPESKEFESLGPFVGFFHPNIGQGAPAGGVKGVAATSPVVGDLAAVPA